jgi:hypothetical protein
MTAAVHDVDVELLKKHLQALIQVEFFTIPFYLTAVYSFTEAALDYTAADGSSPLFQLQQKALSVAVQEMYHLQVAANIANAFDVKPSIPKLTLKAGETITVPHLGSTKHPLKAQLGNLPAEMAAMIAVETPDSNPFPAPNKEVTYASISDLYHATLHLLSAYLNAFEATPMSHDPHFKPNHCQVGYGAFPTRYQYNTIATRDDVRHGMNAISDQGEGNVVSPSKAQTQTQTQAQVQVQADAAHALVSKYFLFGEDGQIMPQYQAAKGSRFYQFDLTTHYKRFEEIQIALSAQDWEQTIGNKPVFYTADGTASPDLPSWAPGLDVLQASMNTIWSYLIDQLQHGFATGHLTAQDTKDPKAPGFNEAMMSVKYIVPLIWQQGAAPSFVYRHHVTKDEVQKAMDAADPLCLFHWDAKTAQIRADHPKSLNACQGLNTCSGLGWGGVATQAGEGACATADIHSCVGSNSCTYQGGCGFLATGSGGAMLPASEEWVPGSNTGASTGGCQVPIATEQVFDRTATIPSGWPADKGALKGQSVWQEARTLFGQRQQLDPLPAPKSGTSGSMSYDGAARRAAIAPTSK